ncbi:MAG: A/G-specific adenine glycosylase [Ilumatobacteraceae bacterium]|nr:A/G-specific adenine glycosylase [Ilumatobacteraceae bacterium]
MLQQTSVARVMPKYEAFLKAFPTPHALAKAPLGEALRLWSGLGYPRRCRNLQATAIVLHEQFDDHMPASIDELLKLPGIGQYTARAILAFAHRIDVAVVDVNVSRVLSRLEGVPMKARALQNFADELVPQGLGWEWNQVMMDFGARHCTVRSPLCDSCPVRTQCHYRGAGDDPAQLSAGVSKPQPRFEGSDRQARGRALRAVADGSLLVTDVIEAMRVDEGRAERLIASLIDEGLLHDTGSTITLP